MLFALIFGMWFGIFPYEGSDIATAKPYDPCGGSKPVDASGNQRTPPGCR